MQGLRVFGWPSFDFPTDSTKQPSTLIRRSSIHPFLSGDALELRGSFRGSPDGLDVVVVVVPASLAASLAAALVAAAAAVAAAVAPAFFILLRAQCLTHYLVYV